MNNNHKPKLDTIKNDPEIDYLILRADEVLGIMEYTEHGKRHASIVSERARDILFYLGYLEREAEVAAIAAYIHDIGNCISRPDHGIASAMLAKPILERHAMPLDEIMLVLNAIGNHEEEDDMPTSAIAAAVSIADKSDVHSSRVKNDEPETFDIHDRVNFAAKNSKLRIDKSKKLISLELEIDTTVIRLMEYFEIFMSRMIACRKAAEFLGCEFSLVMNKTKLL